MASEIRANKQTNRVGLGTVTYTDTGIIVSGIVTATSLSGTVLSSSLSGALPAISGANLTNIPADNLIGTVADARISVLNASKLTGTVADGRISSLTASKLTGALPAISGANLTNLPPSAPVGGASTNTVFFENDKAVAVNYQITSTKNAMSAGPISINAGIAVTVPSGCSWTIV